MTCKVSIAIFLALLFYSNRLTGQYGGYIFSNFTDKDGLPHSTVLHTLEDKDGYIWINTWDGICFYDGRKFHNVELTNEEGASKVNQRFYELADGSICISNSKNPLWEFDKFQNQYPGDSLRGFNNSHNAWNFKNKTIFSQYRDTSFFYYDSLKNNRPISVEIRNKHQKVVQCHVFQIFDNIAWCTVKGNSILAEIEEIDDTTIVGTILNPEIYNIGNNPIFDKNVFFNKDIIEIRDLKLDTLMRFDQHKELLNLNPIRILRNNNDIWIYTKSSRLFIYNIISESLIEIPSFAWNHEITSLDADRSDNVWLATANGLVRAEKSNKWNLYQASNDNIIDERICMLVKDGNGRVWAGGTKGKIFSYDQNSNLDKLIDLPYSDNASTIRYSGRIFGMSLDKNDDLWVSIKDDYSLFKINTTNSNFEKQVVKPVTKDRPDKRILRTILIENESEIWTGGYYSLHHYDRQTKMLSTFTGEEDDGVNIGSIWKIVADNSENLWLGSRNLLQFNSETETFSGFFLNESIPHNQINYVFALYLEPSEKYLWVGSFGDGLHRFDMEDKKFDYSFTEKEGLANNIVYAIYPDNNHRLWLATMDGISCYDKINKSCVNFNLPMNFEINEINSEAHFQDRESGEILLGGMKGALGFYPDTLLSTAENEKLNPIFIHNVRSGGKLLNSSLRINEINKIMLPKGEHQIEFEFVSPNSSPVNISYRYLLEGIDENWIYPSKDRRYVSYNNLKEGVYSFHVQSRLFKRKWEDNSKEVQIKISHFFWQTARFKALIGFMVICIATYITFLKFKNLLLKKDAQGMEIEKQTAILHSLSTQMNPHFLYNSLNSINNFIVNNEGRKANEYLGDFASLMRKILNNSRFEKISLTKELECIDLYVKLEQLRLSNGFVFKKNLDPSLDISNIYIPSMLIQPFIENAIWHGLRHINENGLLELSILKETHDVICRIKDNGVGLTKAKSINGIRKERNSTGIDNVRKRLAILNNINNEKLNLNVSEIITNGVVEGTEVTISISKIA